LVELEAAPKRRARNLSPFEQVGQIFYDFARGRPMAYTVDYKKLEPHVDHVWEFKTPDMRIFGWFARKGHFIASCGGFKENLTSRKFYLPYIEATLNFCNSLDLNEPKKITGVGRDAVL
jgi:hypothetical protein